MVSSMSVQDMRGINVEAIGSTRDRLGESVIWDSLSTSLFWVDSVDSIVRRYEVASGRVESWSFGEPIGSIAPWGDRQLIAAMRDGFYRLDLATGAARSVALPGDAGGRVRFNDGRVDRQGRFIAGTMCSFAHSEGSHAAAVGAMIRRLRDPASRGPGQIYRLNLDLSYDVLTEDFGVTNSIAFSPDGATMYASDSLRYRVWAYDYDGGRGGTSNQRVFADTSDLGMPDGAAIDEAGCLWIACFGGGKLCRFTPEGQRDRILQMPVTTSCCPAFGGVDLDVLFVSSISDAGVGDEFISTDPASGRLYAVRGLGVKGLPQRRFAGRYL